MAQQGVTGILDDPTLELDRDDSLSRKFNDDWQEWNTEDIPNGFAPSDTREALIIATLAPGPHTAIVSGKGNAAGVAIVEAYDLEGATPEALANISTRGLVRSGDNVMIAGFILGGATSDTRIVVRALGPSLGAGGVPNPLRDPTLQLRDSNGTLVRENDNWRDDAVQAGQLTTIGIAPLDPFESAIVATLPSGAYTARVLDKTDAPGTGLVEVYNVP